MNCTYKLNAKMFIVLFLIAGLLVSFSFAFAQEEGDQEFDRDLTDDEWRIAQTYPDLLENGCVRESVVACHEAFNELDDRTVVDKIVTDAKEAELYNPEEEKIVEELFKPAAKAVYEAATSGSLAAMQKAVADLAKLPGLQAALEAAGYQKIDIKEATKQVEVVKTLIDEAQKRGVTLEDCSGARRKDMSREELDACVDLAFAASQRHGDDFARVVGEDAVVIVQKNTRIVEAQKQGAFAGCGDGTMEGCGNFCFDPAKMVQGVSAIPDVCRNLARTVFDVEGGEAELIRAYTQASQPGVPAFRRDEFPGQGEPKGMPFQHMNHEQMIETCVRYGASRQGDFARENCIARVDNMFPGLVQKEAQGLADYLDDYEEETPPQRPNCPSPQQIEQGCSAKSAYPRYTGQYVNGCPVVECVPRDDKPAIGELKPVCQAYLKCPAGQHPVYDKDNCPTTCVTDDVIVDPRPCPAMPSVSSCTPPQVMKTMEMPGCGSYNYCASANEPGTMPGTMPGTKNYVWNFQNGEYYSMILDKPNDQGYQSFIAGIDIAVSKGCFGNWMPGGGDVNNPKEFGIPIVTSCDQLSSDVCPTYKDGSSCGSDTRCEWRTTCVARTNYPSPNPGTSSMYKCTYPNASKKGTFLGNVWCERDYHNCRKGNSAGETVTTDGLMLGAPSSCEGGWSSGTTMTGCGQWDSNRAQCEANQCSFRSDYDCSNKPGPDKGCCMYPSTPVSNPVYGESCGSRSIDKCGVAPWPQEGMCYWSGTVCKNQTSTVSGQCPEGQAWSDSSQRCVTLTSTSPTTGTTGTTGTTASKCGGTYPNYQEYLTLAGTKSWTCIQGTASIEPIRLDCNSPLWRADGVPYCADPYAGPATGTNTVAGVNCSNVKGSNGLTMVSYPHPGPNVGTSCVDADANGVALPGPSGNVSQQGCSNGSYVTSWSMTGWPMACGTSYTPTGGTTSGGTATGGWCEPDPARTPMATGCGSYASQTSCTQQAGCRWQTSTSYGGGSSGGSGCGATTDPAVCATWSSCKWNESYRTCEWASGSGSYTSGDPSGGCTSCGGTWDTTRNMCNMPTCGSGQWWDCATKSCKSSTTYDYRSNLLANFFSVFFTGLRDMFDLTR